jgi:hypothetical protein
MKNLSFVLATSLVAFVGCTEPQAPAGKAGKAGWQPATTNPIQPAAAAARPATPGVSGKVVETMNSGGYTYVQLDTGAQGKVWAAGPTTPVKVGDAVGFAGGQQMQNFESKTLNRTFERIYFAGAFEIAGASAAPSGAASMPAAKNAAKPAAPPVEVGKVAKAEGGLTVAEVFAQSATLAGKQVVLRGKVVKYNSGIMGKNWLHVQDGSGAAGTNDLTVTTDATAEVGDVVVIKGLLTTDKDFGAGYKYAVIVEDASLTK